MGLEASGRIRALPAGLSGAGELGVPGKRWSHGQDPHRGWPKPGLDKIHCSSPGGTGDGWRDGSCFQRALPVPPALQVAVPTGTGQRARCLPGASMHFGLCLHHGQAGQKLPCLPRGEQEQRETQIFPGWAKGEGGTEPVPEGQLLPQALPQWVHPHRHIPATSPRPTGHPWQPPQADTGSPDGSVAPLPPQPPLPQSPRHPLPRTHLAPTPLPPPAPCSCRFPSSAAQRQHAGSERYERLQLLSPKIPSDDTPG